MLSLVQHQESERQARAARIDALVPDRSRFLGGNGAALEKKFTPLASDEQARQDCCEERRRAAKNDESLSGYRVLQQLAGLREPASRLHGMR